MLGLPPSKHDKMSVKCTKDFQAVATNRSQCNSLRIKRSRNKTLVKLLVYYLDHVKDNAHKIACLNTDYSVDMDGSQLLNSIVNITIDARLENIITKECTNFEFLQ